MKIIASAATAASSAPPALAEEPKLSVISAPAAPAPGVSAEELAKIQDQLQAVQKDLKQWRQQWQEELARQIAQIKQEWQAQMGTSTENSKKSAQKLEERLAALEQLPRFAEERMLQQIKESVKKEFASIRIPAPVAAPAPAPQDAWDSDLKKKEKTLQDLKAELAKIPAVPEPVIAMPMPLENRLEIPNAPPFPLDVEGLKKQLAQESSYGTSSRTTSIFAKLWLYLNESAIEIPLKNSKNNS